MPQQLPTHPNLDHLKKQAKDVLQLFRKQNPQWKLADAQRAIARGYGFVNWPSLKMHVENLRDEHRPKLPASRRREESSREDCSIHPIVGTWVADAADLLAEFQLNGDEIKLTQVAKDAAGDEIAITTPICADGREHPVPFGEGVRLKALWTTSLKLEATFTTSERTISSWSYEVSPDGGSLVISTSEQRIVFRRL
jgi:hypothetical protein